MPLFYIKVEKESFLQMELNSITCIEATTFHVSCAVLCLMTETDRPFAYIYLYICIKWKYANKVGVISFKIFDTNYLRNKFLT